MTYIPTKEFPLCPILVTPEADDKLVQYVEASGVEVVRLASGSGCCGKFYSLDFDHIFPDSDIQLQFGKFTIVIDSNNLPDIEGSVIHLEGDTLSIKNVKDVGGSSGCESCPGCPDPEDED